ncbi:hypothetical protein ACHAXN_002672 [Cyclotella atomus]
MESIDDKKPQKKKKTIIKSSLVDHTYYDYSTHELSELLPTSEVKQKGRVTFPMKLHAIVSNPEYRHIIRWQPHGRSWKVLDNKLLAEVICKENFNHESFSSFNRSVNGWGFKRLARQGPDCKSYYHELFLRGRPELAQAMTRLIDPGKRTPDPDGEPDFYDIAKRFPLPDDPHPAAANPKDPEENNAVAKHKVHNFTQARSLNSKPSSHEMRQAGAPAPVYEQPAFKKQHYGRNSFPPDGYVNSFAYPPSPDYGYGRHLYHTHHQPYAHQQSYPPFPYYDRSSHHVHHSYSPEMHYGYDHHWRGRHSYDNMQRAAYDDQNYRQPHVDRHTDHSRNLYSSSARFPPPVIHHGYGAANSSPPRDSNTPDADKGRKSILRKLEFSEQRPTKLVISVAGIQAAADFEQQKPAMTTQPEPDEKQVNNDNYYSLTSIATENTSSRNCRTDSLGSMYEFFMEDDANMATTDENDKQD